MKKRTQLKIDARLAKFSVISVLALGLIATVSPVFAQSDEDKKFLLMYFTEEELVVESPTRSPKPVSQVAENVTVVTAQEIKLMNAHTVADVLNFITGVQVTMTGAPGSAALASIQGSDPRHVSVFMDGIPLNNVSSNVTDVGSLPVQNIEKIEIIKGPASSAWGSALGGVINIITKAGSQEGLGGVVSASYGKKNTGDFRMETSGKEDGLGYYFTAGRLQTDGFRPHNDFWGNNAYAKVTYDITKDTTALLTLGYDKLARGEVEIPNEDLFIDNKLETFMTSFGIRSNLNKETGLDFSVWEMNQKYSFFNRQVSSGMELSKEHNKDEGEGSSIKLTWKPTSHNIVLGADYDSKKLESNRIAGEEQKLTKWAVFINDTMSFGPLSIIPGVRQDHTNSNGNFTSPSFGTTYKVADTTLLRAYAARGFSVPPLGFTYGDNLFYTANPALKMENVWSYQLGTETAALKYLWLKLSGFRHDVKDVIKPEALSPMTFTNVNGGKQRRQGIEVEMKTAPVYHTSLSAGAAFIDTKDRDTGQKIKGVPQKTYDVGLQYDNEKVFTALLKGHYIYWNTDPFYQGKYNSFIFDLHVMKNLFIYHNQSLEAFVDIHNIFNGSQYPLALYINPKRWVEAGVRYSF